MDKMREDFEKAASSMALDPLFDYKRQRYYSQRTRGAWDAWQHLYPEVEAAYREGYRNGDAEARHGSGDCDENWNNSTANARLEGKDD